MERVENLFLIIGTNPMPNLIAISNRLKKGGKVYLICSEENIGFDTGEIARKIEEVLKNKNIDSELIKVIKEDEKSIEHELEIKIGNYIKNESVEFNFTGGTKLMASTMYNYVKNRKENYLLSYIDIIKNTFIFENKKNVYFEEINEKEFEKVFNLDEIATSHKINRIKSKEFKYKGEVKEIGIKMILELERADLKEKQKWIYNVEQAVASNKKYKNLDQLKSDFNKYFEEYLLKEEIDCILSQKDVERFIAGDNLEIYYYNILNELREEKIIDDFKWSFTSKKEDNNDRFEVDFIILKGIKLILLSVTLENCDEICKLKLLEARMRAEEIGGDEAYFGFVCLGNNKKELDEIITNKNYRKDRSLIIGINEFYNLKGKIREWLYIGE